MAFQLLLLLLLLLLIICDKNSHAQQSYVNNKQLDCNQNHTTTLGFVCNGATASCISYLTFRSTPTYNSPVTIAYLLSADASRISAANGISDVDPLPVDTLVIVPVNCSCSGDYYQHNASYVLKPQTENYFTVANDTYQALTTCQSMIAQNPYNFRLLRPRFRLSVPLRCACPTTNQTSAGYSYLLTYLVRPGDTYNSIAASFSGAGTDVQGILQANELTVDHIIFFFTPILVPLKIQPSIENINTGALPPPTAAPAPPINRSNSSRKWIFIGLGVGAAVLLLLSAISLWFFCDRRRRNPPPPPPKLESAAPPFSSDWSISSQGIQSATETLTVYKFEELEKATASFAESNRINASSVYRGSFKGDDAVVKVMKGDVSREINALRQINHSHTIRLSGFCLHQGVTYLVYEYADKGSLSDWLLPHPKNKDYTPLDWKQRVQIAYDVADALNYLHNFANPTFIHSNLKSSNILLDGNGMRAKVANFGLARSMDRDAMTRHVVGTYGYMAPEYIESGLITPKLDVFAFGVVMLELLSGREPIANEERKNEEGDDDRMVVLSESIEVVLGGDDVREKLREFMDPLLREEYPLELAYSMAELARRCVAQDLDARPNVSELFVALLKLLSSSLDWDPSHDESFSIS